MKKVSIGLIVFVWLVLFTKPVYAYLDPGSGSMVLQLILGGLAGVAVILKLYWRRLLNFFGIAKNKKILPE